MAPRATPGVDYFLILTDAGEARGMFLWIRGEGTLSTPIWNHQLKRWVEGNPIPYLDGTASGRAEKVGEARAQSVARELGIPLPP